jgi:hypothetical protein
MRHPEVTDEQIQLIEQTMQNIRKHKNNFCMLTFISRPVTNGKTFLQRNNSLSDLLEVQIENEEYCGTRMCFAGWLIYTKNQNMLKSNQQLHIPLEHDVDEDGCQFDVVPGFDFIALRALGFEEETVHKSIRHYNSIEHPTLSLCEELLYIFFDSRCIVTVEDLEKKLKEIGVLEGNPINTTIENNQYIAHEELFPYHGVEDAAKFESLVADMQVNGWTGVPLVKFDSLLLTGSHRYEAAKEAGIAIPVVDLLDIFCIDDEVAKLIEEGSQCLEVELTRLAIEDNAELAAELGMDIH